MGSRAAVRLCVREHVCLNMILAYSQRVYTHIIHKQYKSDNTFVQVTWDVSRTEDMQVERTRAWNRLNALLRAKDPSISLRAFSIIMQVRVSCTATTYYNVKDYSDNNNNCPDTLPRVVSPACHDSYVFFISTCFG